MPIMSNARLALSGRKLKSPPMMSGRFPRFSSPISVRRSDTSSST